MCKKDKVKFADNFAVKESVSKMLGTGFTGIKPIDIEVLRDSKGKPYVNMYGACLEKSIELGIRKVFVTISNTKEFSMAFVVGEGYRYVQIVVNASTMKAIDNYTINEIGIPSLVLMERAALAVADCVKEHIVSSDKILAICAGVIMVQMVLQRLEF